ncbi:MAG TPA: CusA/CzcA family heavy metal efflux RND transporter [Opitutaceae bacterium]|jgi:Cu(I)/Ag(I) efflux system membrane protein CusA/SilA
MTFVERVIDASARNPFLVLVLTGLAVAGAWWALRQTPLDAIPDLSDTQVIISTDWPGRSPDLVDDQITYPISTRFIAAPKVKFVRGESMFGKSFVYVIFADGTDIYWARSRVLEYLNSVRGSLPDGVNPTIGPDATGVGWVYEYALVDDTGQHSLAQLRSFQDWNLRYVLESVKGVAEVAPVGGFVKEYQVDLDPNKLAAFGIPLADVVAKLRTSNNDVGGKIFEVGSTEYYVRGRGYLHSLGDIEGIPLKVAKGTPVRIRDVGRVHFGPGFRRGLAELDGQGEVVGGIVVMRYGENALTVIQGIKAKLKEIGRSLPPGVRIVPTYDRSVLINASIATLREKLIEESIVVALVCLIFLWHVRSSLVAIVTLPIAVLLAFLPMWRLGLTSNIMSLGGIAIAVGAMVDAAIIMIENAHKQLEQFRQEQGRDPSGAERTEVIIAAARSVGRPLFFSLLVITVSFVPVFSLTAEEGRLFRPLAFTKTFAMGFSALLAVTLVPVLMRFLVRGRIVREERNPINRLLIWAYRPVAQFVLRYRWPTLAAAALVLALTVIPYRRLGKEFMPPLNEGTILFMPTAVPGLSIEEAARIIQVQDRVLKQFPEVATVFGKAGQADTATDPAPLSMFETVVTLKPRDQWRTGMTWEKIIAEMNGKLKTPGMANIFWMPIQTRTEMLTTGFRSALGIKVFGPDLPTIQKLGVEIENALADLPGTRSVFAERTTGGYFLDFAPRREAAARYGLTSGDVNQVIETAVGGNIVTTTVEGRERYPVTVRYARDFRSDLGALKRVLVPTPTGAQVPIGELADLSFRTGPPDIREENGQLVGLVFVDATSSDIDGYVRSANARLARRLRFPAGAYIQWAGQFESLKSAEQRLQVVVPFTLLVIFILIYLNTRSAARTAIVLLAVPFSLVGAVWLLYLLHYNLSVAVWVGLIALAGLDAETGVVMLLYLDQAWDKFQAAGRLRTPADLHEAIIEGAVLRIRPKIMTVCAILFGLLPILWSPVTQSGADVMKRIAAPMVGGVVTSAILELLLYPAIYLLWRRRHLPEPRGKELNQGRTPIGMFVALAGLAAAGALWRWQDHHRPPARTATPATAPLATATAAGVRLNLYREGGVRLGDNRVLLEFEDPQTGAALDVGAVAFTLDMNMPGMTMHSGATVSPEGKIGRYWADIKPDMAGDWTASISYHGPGGNGAMGLSLTVAR